MHDRRAPIRRAQAWPIRPHRRFAMHLAGGFWAPSDSSRRLRSLASLMKSSPEQAQILTHATAPAAGIRGSDPARTRASRRTRQNENKKQSLTPRSRLELDTVKSPRGSPLTS